MPSTPDISVVVPIFNEEDSLPILYREVREAIEAMGSSFELILVDDHSSDTSLARMLELRAGDPRVKVLHFRRNFGQTAAMSAGFEAARGAIVVTMDGDLQNDPADIPRLVAKMREGFDIVAGWRKNRQDGFVLRRVPSLVANRLIAWVTDTPIHDTGCTLKAFRAKLVKNLSLYAEQHRFLPAMSRGSGAQIAEIVVNHRARRFGHSKYGLERALRVLLDLFVIKLISQFAHRPLHYFGLFSLPFATLAWSVLFLAVDWSDVDLATNWPQWAFTVFSLFLLPAVHFVLLGLLSELVVMASGVNRRSVLERLVNRRAQEVR
ncbi:MAG: glycosyltransferase family 2 protein [Planctomycetes bacterium]|nr:glycosyltransferase family 2 protein [Planctomycetota bacterium]